MYSHLVLGIWNSFSWIPVLIFRTSRSNQDDVLYCLLSILYFLLSTSQNPVHVDHLNYWDYLLSKEIGWRLRLSIRGTSRTPAPSYDGVQHVPNIQHFQHFQNIKPSHFYILSFRLYSVYNDPFETYRSFLYLVWKGAPLRVCHDAGIQYYGFFCVLICAYTLGIALSRGTMIRFLEYCSLHSSCYLTTDFCVCLFAFFYQTSARSWVVSSGSTFVSCAVSKCGARIYAWIEEIKQSWGGSRNTFSTSWAIGCRTLARYYGGCTPRHRFGAGDGVSFWDWCWR